MYIEGIQGIKDPNRQTVSSHQDNIPFLCGVNRSTALQKLAPKLVSQLYYFMRCSEQRSSPTTFSAGINFAPFLLCTIHRSFRNLRRFATYTKKLSSKVMAFLFFFWSWEIKKTEFRFHLEYVEVYCAHSFCVVYCVQVTVCLLLAKRLQEMYRNHRVPWLPLQMV